MLAKSNFESILDAGKPYAAATKRSRVAYVFKLYRDIDGESNDLTFLNKAKLVLSHVNESKSNDARKTKLFHVIAFAATPAGRKVVQAAVVKKYKELGDKLRETAYSESLNNVMPEKHKENMLSISECNTRLERSIIALFEKFNLPRSKKISDEDFARLTGASRLMNAHAFARELQKHMIVASYVWQPALRSDWNSLEISSAAANRLSDEQNWLQVLRSGRIRIMMNQFKNVKARSMGSIILEVENPKLKAYIRYWIDLLKRLIGAQPKHLFLYNFDASKSITTPVRTDNSFTQAIKRASESILKTPMTVNSYRHA